MTMDNQHDQDPAAQELQAEAQAEMQEPQFAPEIAEAIQAGTINAATLDKIDNENGRLTTEETIRVARTLEQMEPARGGIALGAMAAGAEAPNGLMLLLQEFFGGGDSFKNMQDMTGQVFEALKTGELTEGGQMPAGSALEGLIAQAQSFAPQPQPAAPQEPTTAQPMQNPGM